MAIPGRRFATAIPPSVQDLLPQAQILLSRYQEISRKNRYSVAVSCPEVIDSTFLDRYA